MKSFVYLHSTDLVRARHFYTDVIGLDEIFYSVNDATVAYRIGTLQLAITADADVPSSDGWARQLGWTGGTKSNTSWGFELTGHDFRTAISAIVAADVPAFRSEPAWVGYWSFPVQDPMGNTVEITTPDATSWP